MAERTSDSLTTAVATASAVKKLARFNRRIQQKTVKISEQSKPVDVKRYLKTMNKSTFQGDEERTDANRVKLGETMKKLSLLIAAGKAFSEEAESTVDALAELRSKTVEDVKESDGKKEKIKMDYHKFIKTRERAIRKAEEAKRKTGGLTLEQVPVLTHDEFWGTRQQLRSGKVVGDMLGGLDPVYGVLLNPTGGRVGKGDSERLHKMFYKEEESLAYHSAVHDAFGYLIQFHNVGPGYNYLNTKWTFFRKESPLACQVAGLKFWRKVLKRAPVDKQF